MKLKKDFGVRALLATICLAAYEAILILVIIILWRIKEMDAQTGTTILTAAQAPALMALGFYFGTRSGGDTGSNCTPSGTAGAT